jgi:hypothetical protein
MAGITHIDSAVIGAIVKSLIVYSLKMTKLDTLIEMFPAADEVATGFEAGPPAS